MSRDTAKPSTIRRLAEYLACAPGTIRAALQQQSSNPGAGGTQKRIGEILQELGVASRDEIETAIRRQRADRLQQCYVFSSLTQPELVALTMRFREASVSARIQLIIQDKEDPTLYILAAGKAEVYRTDLDGNWTHIAWLGPGEPIGEMGYFQGGRRTASVRALERCELLCANYSDLTHYFENVPRVAYAFMKLVQERQQTMDEIMQSRHP